MRKATYRPGILLIRQIIILVPASGRGDHLHGRESHGGFAFSFLLFFSIFGHHGSKANGSADRKAKSKKPAMWEKRDGMSWGKSHNWLCCDHRAHREEHFEIATVAVCEECRYICFLCLIPTSSPNKAVKHDPRIP